MVPAEGEQECLKIQLEKGPLANLVEVFLGVTQGFTVPAGAIALLALASLSAPFGADDFATGFVRASGALRGPSLGLSWYPLALGVTQPTLWQSGQLQR